MKLDDYVPNLDISMKHLHMWEIMLDLDRVFFKIQLLVFWYTTFLRFYLLDIQFLFTFDPQ